MTRRPLDLAPRDLPAWLAEQAQRIVEMNARIERLNTAWRALNGADAHECSMLQHSIRMTEASIRHVQADIEHVRNKYAAELRPKETDFDPSDIAPDGSGSYSEWLQRQHDIARDERAEVGQR